MKKAIRLAAVILSMASSAALAEVKLASVFTDHMVLQRDKAVRIWGTAAAGKTVTVKAAGAEASATADGAGNWSLELPKHAASESPTELTATEAGGNTVTLSDILYGDVWICSGQSNMAFSLDRASNAADAIPAATDDKVRLLVVPRVTSDEPQLQQKGAWTHCTPETAKTFSAVGYFFGQQLRLDEHVPVGLIGTYWGGTPAESWTPKSHLAGAEWEPLWDRDKKLASGATKSKNPHRPTVLWNGMVEPLVPMSITGVIWYQGEVNAGRAEQYRSLFPNMIQAWRDAFKQGDVPFLFVQLANYGKSNGDSDAGSNWAELREAQAMTLKLPNTGMAVAIDVGNPTNIHPTDKLTVGKRLALAAEHVAYGKDVACQGPTYESLAINGHTVTLTFAHADGLATKDNAPVKGFTVAGDDKKFVPATSAKVEGNKVIVTAPESIGTPTAIRYGWAGDPETSLYNAAALPMVPFRTDDWPGVTAGKK